MTKQAPAMRKLAYQKAIRNGERIVEVNGKRYAAYTVTKDELEELFENNGFNTEGISWLNMICRWRKVGEFVPPDHVVKDPARDNWFVSPLFELTDLDKDRLKGFAGHQEIGQVLI